MKYDDDLLRAAVAGYQLRAEAINRAMDVIRQKLAGKTYITEHGQPCCPVHDSDYDLTCAICRDINGQGERKPYTKRTMSPAARRRIAAAQRARWAEWRKKHKKAA